jgi:predicted TPR repeat methyltransferase
VRRTRQEREAALLATDEGKAALVANLGKARGAYERTIALDPAYAAAYRGLAQVAERLGESRAAARAYVEYLQRAPEANDRPVVVERLRALRDAIRNEESGDVPTTTD